MPGKFKANFKDPVEQNTEIIPIDFYENKSEIFIDAKLPGVVIKTPLLVYSYYAHYRWYFVDVDKSNIEVTVDHKGTLHIHAKKNKLKDTLALSDTDEEPSTVMERVESEMKYYILERSSDTLDRSISLPADADR